MIIGITGNIRAGKDTVAKMIQMFYHQQMFKTPTNVLLTYLDEPLYRSHLHNSNWQIKKFAAKLKQIAAILVGCNAEDFESQEFKDKVLSDEWQFPNQIINSKAKFTNRWLLQTLGTEAIRENINDRAWINALFVDYRPTNLEKRADIGGAIDYSDCEFPNWIISDVRFKNEVQAILDRNGIIIKITRGNQSTSEHKSETELNSIIPNFHIENDGTIEELYQKVSDFLKNSNL